MTREGDIAALAVRPHRIGVEADAAKWWAALLDALAEIGTEGVRGIAIGGFTRSQVLVDAAGVPVRPAQCFPDGRADPVPGAEAGTWMAMTAFHPAARLAWVARHDPAALAQARYVLQPADFLSFQLTRRAASDRIANCWAIDRQGAATTGPLRRAGVSEALLPELLAPGAALGTARDVAGLAGVPVFQGSMDTWVASLGAGVGRPEDAYLIAGTTDAGGVLTASPAERPGLVTLPWGDGVFHTGGPSAAGGACLEWAARLLRLADTAAVIALAQTAGEAPPLLFIPALIGSRAPYWRAEARGALLGLDMAHGPAEIARAVLEGIACADRDLFGGLDFDRLVIAGGGARADFACQVRADVLGRPVHRVAGEPGLAGAAVLAWVGLGVYASVAEAQAVMCRPDRVFLPCVSARHERLYSAFARAQEASSLLTDSHDR